MKLVCSQHKLHNCIVQFELHKFVSIKRNRCGKKESQLSFSCIFVSWCSLIFFIDIRAHWRFCSLPRCWIYREFPIHWSISSVTEPWSTCDLQFGKYVFSWCGKLVSWGLHVRCFMHLIKCGKTIRFWCGPIILFQARSFLLCLW